MAGPSFQSQPLSCPAFRVCSDPSDCWDNSQSTADCWTTVWILLGVGSALVIYGEICLTRRAPLEHFIDWWTARRRAARRHRGKDDDVDVPEAESEEDGGDDAAFVKAVRTERHFIQDLGPDGGAEFFTSKGGPTYVPKRYSLHTYAFTVTGTIKNFRYLGVTYIHTILLSSLGWGLISSSVSTVLWLITARDEYCYEKGYAEDRPNADHIQELSDKFRILYGQYVFLPIFLLWSYVGYVSWRWRDLQIQCNVVEDSIKDVALICGGIVVANKGEEKAGGRGEVSVEDRRALFRIYRYLNCVHAMTYKSISPTLGPLGYDTNFVNMGLLTKGEAREVLLAGGEERNFVIGLLLSEVIRLVERHALPAIGGMCKNVQRVRETTEGLLDRLYSRDQPNTFLDLMIVMSSLWIVLIVIAEAFALFVYAGGDLIITPNPCFQPLVVFGVFLLTSIVRIAYVLIYILRHPFSTMVNADALKVDNYITSTERSTFVLMRALFGRSGLDKDLESSKLDEGADCHEHEGGKVMS